MHSVSQTYKNLFRGLHTVMTVAEIETKQNGATVYEELEADKLYSVKISGALFPNRSPSIGNFCAREADVVLIPPTNAVIPRMARIRLFVYLTNGSSNSERIPKGVFYIDTRSYDKAGKKLSIHAYDAALMFDADYSSNLSWPAKAESVVQEIAQSVGIPIKSGVIDYIKKFSTRNVPLMPNLTKRDILCGIAAMFCANWTITDDGKLDLVPFNTNPRKGPFPPEVPFQPEIPVPPVVSSYLVDELGNRITIGGDRIVVG